MQGVYQLSIGVSGGCSSSASTMMMTTTMMPPWLRQAALTHCAWCVRLKNCAVRVPFNMGWQVDVWGTFWKSLFCPIAPWLNPPPRILTWVLCWFCCVTVCQETIGLTESLKPWHLGGVIHSATCGTWNASLLNLQRTTPPHTHSTRIPFPPNNPLHPHTQH